MRRVTRWMVICALCVYLSLCINQIAWANQLGAKILLESQDASQPQMLGEGEMPNTDPDVFTVSVSYTESNILYTWDTNKHDWIYDDVKSTPYAVITLTNREENNPVKATLVCVPNEKTSVDEVSVYGLSEDTTPARNAQVEMALDSDGGYDTVYLHFSHTAPSGVKDVVASAQVTINLEHPSTEETE